MDHIVHATHIDVLVETHQADRLSLKLDHRAQNRPILDGVDVAIAARHCDPVFHVVKPENGDERRYRSKLHLGRDVECRTVQDINHPVLCTQHQHTHCGRFIHVLFQHLHARDRSVLLQERFFRTFYILQLLLLVLHRQQVNGVVRQRRAIFSCRIQLLATRGDISRTRVHLLPYFTLQLIDLDGGQRKLQVRSHVPVDENLVSAGNRQRWDRRSGNLVEETLHSTGYIQ
mmetsp:Transcript_5050/g.13988  ORF Transcript_5050/g.13988 Transcript_5050/m.13988 type:complete len:230 (+) Transcript_5050:1248-1937(+)